jgi:hypothetical protein
VFYSHSPIFRDVQMTSSVLGAACSCKLILLEAQLLCWSRMRLCWMPHGGAASLKLPSHCFSPW